MAEGLAEAGAVADALRAPRGVAHADGRRDARAAAFASKACCATSRRPTDVQAVVDETMATFGRIDILVNNAGVTWAAEPEQLPLDKWQKVVDVNLTGAFLFAQAAGREMLKQQLRAASSTSRRSPGCTRRCTARTTRRTPRPRPD
mgnify:CR=1 FL=1